jgi:hypothetical protein
MGCCAFLARGDFEWVCVVAGRGIKSLYQIGNAAPIGGLRPLSPLQAEYQAGCWAGDCCVWLCLLSTTGRAQVPVPMHIRVSVSLLPAVESSQRLPGGDGVGGGRLHVCSGGGGEGGWRLARHVRLHRQMCPFAGDGQEGVPWRRAGQARGEKRGRPGGW